MAHPSPFARPESPASETAGPPAEDIPDLPGCEPFPLTERELETYDERLEFWDARTETAWRLRDVSLWHEQPAQRLAMLAARIASVRGAPIGCFGSASLVRLDAAGHRRQLMQADNLLYLHPARWQEWGRNVNVDADPLPDVVLEVDHTTDVRRWKLGKYQEWGFPEIWVLVPWQKSRRTPGLTIHLREAGGSYRQASESAAFPGRTVGEIHRALTEEPLSTAAWQAVERVGRALGARAGTTPEDDPLTRSLHDKAQAMAQVEAVGAVLRARGIDVPADFSVRADLLAGCSIDAAMAAALDCTDAADFRRCVREKSR